MPFEAAGNVRDFVDQSGWDFVHARPDREAAPGGYCMVQPGVEAVCYFHAPGAKSLELAPGSYRARWWSLTSGGFGPWAAFEHGGGPHAFTTPAGADWVLQVALPAPPAFEVCAPTRPPAVAVAEAPAGDGTVRGSCGCGAGGTLLPLAVAVLLRRRFPSPFGSFGRGSPPMKPRVLLMLCALAASACLGVATDLERGIEPPAPVDAGADAEVTPDAGVDAGAGDPGADSGCAPLLRIGLGVYYTRVGNDITGRTGAIDNPAFIGDLVMMNSTPRVAEYEGDARGQEQPIACTDPLGPLWSPGLNVRPNPWLAAFTPAATGDYLVRACPRSGPGTCGEVTVYVR